MRILKPEVAEERKRRLLQWVIHRFIKTSSPVSSKAIAEEGRFNLSPATIRNILKELEDEGFLDQEHHSAGRIPTDKGYRLYVDYLAEVQRLASAERERIEGEYHRRMAELDEVLSQTSRLLSTLSRSAGFALSPKLGSQPVRRLELVPMSPSHALAIVVTQAGSVRHWPVRLPEAVAPERLLLLGRFLNESLRGMNAEQIREELPGKVEQAEREFRELAGFARSVLGTITPEEDDELFLEGTASLAGLDAGDPDQLRALLSVVEDRRRLARILQEEFEDQLKAHLKEASPVQVRIGGENRPELRHLSLVTSTYEAGDRHVGLLGILGPKRMEYPKMMGLVRFIGTVVSETLSRWEEIYGDRKEGDGQDARKRR